MEFLMPNAHSVCAPRSAGVRLLPVLALIKGVHAYFPRIRNTDVKCGERMSHAEARQHNGFLLIGSRTVTIRSGELGCFAGEVQGGGEALTYILLT